MRAIQTHQIRGLILAAAVLGSPVAVAQTAPPPATPLPAPLLEWRGRYLDSGSTSDNVGPQTFRAQLIRVAPELDRIFMKLGGDRFAIYTMSGFENLLAGVSSTGPYGEVYAEPDVLVDPDEAGSEWITHVADGTEWLYDFDWDSRGNVVLAYSGWGWGIIAPDGSLLSQIPDPGTSAETAFTVEVDGKFHAVISGSPDTVIYDISDPTQPLLVRRVSVHIAQWEKLEGGMIAFIEIGSARTLNIIEPAALVEGDSSTELPLPEGNELIDIASSGETIYTSERFSSQPQPSGGVYAVSPTGSARDEIWSSSTEVPEGIFSGSGYVIFDHFGRFPDSPAVNIAFYDIEDGFLHPDPFQSSGHRVFPWSLATYSDGKVDLLIAGLFGLGELFSIAPAAEDHILWRHDRNGSNAVWLLDGAVVTGTASLPGVADLNWKIAGSADFDGDGENDLVWRHAADGGNAVWFLEGPSASGAAPLPGVTNLNWQIAGVADFDSDGDGDILWRNAATFDSAVWIMEGTSFVTAQTIPGVTDPAWRIEGAADFDGDRKPDIVWRNYTTGENAVWLMDGTNFAGSAALPGVYDLNWRMEAFGDYDDDGDTDIVWRHYGDGGVAYWYFDGTTMTGAAGLPGVFDLDWQIVAP